MLYFLDLEASSLGQGSYPIEVAWVAEDGVSESHLIRPEPGWTDWSVASETVHGISREHLEMHGRPAAEVARRAAAVLGAPGAVPVSDNAAFDQFWLAALLDAAGLLPLAVAEAREVYTAGCRPLRALMVPPGAGGDAAERRWRAAAAGIIRDAEAAEAARRRVRHRALPDAEGLHWIWREVRERVALAVGG